MKKIVSKISQTPADPDKPRHRGTLFIEGVPSETLRLFSAMCARHEWTQRDAIIQFMWQAIKSRWEVPKRTEDDTSKPVGRGVMLVEGIPLDTKSAFKSSCKLKRKTMRHEISRFMWEYGHGTYKLRRS